MARRRKKAGATPVAGRRGPRSQDEILVVRNGKLEISTTDDEKREFLQHVRDFSESRVLGPPGVRANYYHLRDKPWSFIVPDYRTTNPDGSEKRVLWSEWVSRNLRTARKLWLAGDRGPDALDPELLDDDGDSDIQDWLTHDDAEDYGADIPTLRPGLWAGQPKRLLVLCEKAGMSGIVRSACRGSKTDYMCCGGDATMRQKFNVGQWALRARTDGLDPIVLYAGDHDMQGVNMDKTLVRDIADVNSVIRVAITLEQARERDLPLENVYDKMHLDRDVAGAKKGQNTKLWNYIDEHGEDMVELNALVARNELALRDIIKEAIAEHIDERIWKRRKRAIKKPVDRAAELMATAVAALKREFPEGW
jgi:hypothetical protein